MKIPLTALVLFTFIGSSAIVDESLAQASEEPRLINISTRGHVGSGTDVMIGGFVISGDEPMTVLVQAVGQELDSADTLEPEDVLADPTLWLVTPDETDGDLINDNWGGDADIALAQTQVGSYQLAEEGKSSALLATFDPGAYTVIVSSADGGEGIALVEVYEVPDEEEVAPFSGDVLETNAGDAIIHPVDHAAFMLSWDGVIICNDPTGGAEAFEGLPSPDIIMVTHEHPDHFNTATIEAIRKPSTVIVTTVEVYGRLSADLQAITTQLSNGDSVDHFGVNIEAIPAYNDRHAKGVGNGYVVTLGGKRLYASGDTEDVAEMRALEDIDVAFVAMNQPYTMTVTQAASAVREFQPKVVYPYHYRNDDGSFADLEDFKTQVGTDLGIEVWFGDWY